MSSPTFKDIVRMAMYNLVSDVQDILMQDECDDEEILSQLYEAIEAHVDGMEEPIQEALELIVDGILEDLDLEDSAVMHDDGIIE